MADSDSKPDAEDDPLLTVPEIARRLRVTEWTVREWIKSDILHGWRPGLRNYRVPQSEFDRFVRERSTRPPAESLPASTFESEVGAGLGGLGIDDAVDDA